jgi:hypothetical protein
MTGNASFDRAQREYDNQMPPDEEEMTAAESKLEAEYERADRCHDEQLDKQLRL